MNLTLFATIYSLSCFSCSEGSSLGSGSSSSTPLQPNKIPADKITDSSAKTCFLYFILNPFTLHLLPLLSSYFLKFIHKQLKTSLTNSRLNPLRFLRTKKERPSGRSELISSMAAHYQVPMSFSPLSCNNGSCISLTFASLISSSCPHAPKSNNTANGKARYFPFIIKPPMRYNPDRHYYPSSLVIYSLFSLS